MEGERKAKQVAIENPTRPEQVNKKAQKKARTRRTKHAHTNLWLLFSFTLSIHACYRNISQ